MCAGAWSARGARDGRGAEVVCAAQWPWRRQGPPQTALATVAEADDLLYARHMVGGPTPVTRADDIASGPAEWDRLRRASIVFAL
jgi:hypothetical protein